MRAAFRRVFDTAGRASLKEYLGSLVVVIPAAYAVSRIPDSGWLLLVRAPLVLLLVAVLLPLQVRRLHDTGRPGTDLVWGLLPCVGGLVVTWWTLQPGDPSPNGFDLPPTGRPQGMRLRVHRRRRLDADGNEIGREYVDDWGNVVPDDQVH